MMFNMFVNLFWRAEGCGSMWVPFELGYFNNLCLVFSHEKQKKSNIYVQKPITNFMVLKKWVFWTIMNSKAALALHFEELVVQNNLFLKDVCIC